MLTGNEWEPRSARTRAQSCCSTRGTCFAHFKRRPGGGRWDEASKRSANGSGWRDWADPTPAPPPSQPSAEASGPELAILLLLLRLSYFYSIGPVPVWDRTGAGSRWTAASEVPRGLS